MATGRAVRWRSSGGSAGIQAIRRVWGSADGRLVIGNVLHAQELCDLALAVYIGKQGLDSYRHLQEMGHVPMNALQAQEFMLSQSRLQCSLETKDVLSPQELAVVRSYGKARGITFRGANAFPQFIKYQPARYPWPVQEAADVQLLCEALTAALEVSEKLAAASKAAQIRYIISEF